MKIWKSTAVLSAAMILSALTVGGCENADESRPIEVETTEGAMDLGDGDVPDEVNIAPGPTAD